MTDLATFAMFLSDVSPRITLIDGRFFLDRHNVGPEGLRKQIAKYENIGIAQQWINMVPIDDFVSCAVDNWSIDDPIVQQVADVYARSWLGSINALYGAQDGLSVDVLRDQDTGDVVIQLKQR